MRLQYKTTEPHLRNRSLLLPCIQINLFKKIQNFGLAKKAKFNAALSPILLSLPEKFHCSNSFRIFSSLTSHPVLARQTAPITSALSKGTLYSLSVKLAFFAFFEYSQISY